MQYLNEDQVDFIFECKCDGTDLGILGFIPKGMNLDGYGVRIHTPYRIKLKGEIKARKVFASCCSNVAMYYIIRGKEKIVIRDTFFETKIKNFKNS